MTKKTTGKRAGLAASRPSNSRIRLKSGVRRKQPEEDSLTNPAIVLLEKIRSLLGMAKEVLQATALQGKGELTIRTAESPQHHAWISITAFADQLTYAVEFTDTSRWDVKDPLLLEAELDARKRNSLIGHVPLHLCIQAKPGDIALMLLAAFKGYQLARKERIEFSKQVRQQIMQLPD